LVFISFLLPFSRWLKNLLATIRLPALPPHDPSRWNNANGGYGALWMKEVRSGYDLGHPANISLIVRKYLFWLIREVD
jgi:hypothetical protein